MKLNIREITLFPLLGTLMFISKLLLEFLPNVHLLGMLTVTYTVVYRKKALIPIYIYVFLNGIYSGFSLWWIPYLYIWTVLWAAVMLLPKEMPKKIKPIAYMLVCSLHGFLFGTLYAPVQAIVFGLNFKGMIAWIIAGFPFDIIHGISNLLAGSLILPVSSALKKVSKTE